MRARTHCTLLLVAAALVACGKSAPPPASFDAGPPPDGTAGFDLPPLPDNGPPPADTAPDLPGADAPDGAAGMDAPDGATGMDVPDGGTSTDAGGMDARDTGTDTPVVRFDTGVDAGPPRRDGPRLIAPLSGTASTSRRPTFRWAAFTGAAHYRVEYATTRTFAPVEGTFTVDAAMGSPPADLGPGRRYWRVVPILSGGAAGPASLVWEIDLGRAPGDLDGDGFADVLVGAPVRSGNLGAVDVFLGGATLPTVPSATLAGRSPAESFGSAISNAGDLNGDGYTDLLVGAPQASTAGAGAGRAYVFLGSGHMGSMPALVIDGPAAGSAFGSSVAILGDVNGDGYDDFAVGAPLEASGGPGAGRVHVYFGGPTLDATRTTTLSFAVPGDQFGRSLAGAGDVDGDGYADVLVGAPHNAAGGTESGQGYLYLGGSTFHFAPDQSYPGMSPGIQAGTAVAGLGDFNNDGYADVAVGAPFNAAGAPSGQVVVIDGSWPTHGAPDLRITGATGEAFGRVLAGPGDLNGDGFADLVVGAPFNGEAGLNAGHAYFYPGADRPTSVAGATFASSIGGDQFGAALSAAGDVDHDGIADLVVGAPFAPFTSRTGPGTAYLFRGGGIVSVTPAASFRGMADDQYGSAVAWRAVFHHGGRPLGG